MAYTPPTAVTFKARFPAFAAVDDSVIDTALAEAASQVDTVNWTEADFALGRMLYAAHTLTLDGHGTSAEAQAPGFKVIKSGGLTLERFTKGEGGAGQGIEATSYGQRFAVLRRQNVGTIRVLEG